MARTMKTLGAGDPFADTQYSRENPVENALQAFSNYGKPQLNFMALQQAREKESERAALKNALAQGIDMENPDFGRILAASPSIGLKFMEDITKLNTQKRLLAASKAKEGMEWMQSAMGGLYHQANPAEGYAAIIENGKKMGLTQEVLAMVPDPRKYTSQEAYRGALHMTIGPLEGLKAIAELAKQDAITAREREKIESKGKIETLKANVDIYTADKRYASAKLTSTGGTQPYFNEKTQRWHTLRLAADGTQIDKEHPEGFVPQEIIKQRMIAERAGNKNKPIDIDGIDGEDLTKEELIRQHKEYIAARPDKKAEADASLERRLKKIK
jgi:hypothetical protein